MVWRSKSNKTSRPETSEANTSTNANTNTNENTIQPEARKRKRLKEALHHHCYLLRSLDPGHPNSTYIGYTVNPHNRIRQHNGEKKGGAHRTRKYRPWTFVAVVHGFQSPNTGMAFEWHWQHPYRSTYVKNSIGQEAAVRFKRQYNIRAKLKILKTLLAECEDLTRGHSLTVYFFEQTWKNIFDLIKMESGALLPPTITSHLIQNFQQMIFWQDRLKRQTILRSTSGVPLETDNSTNQQQSDGRRQHKELYPCLFCCKPIPTSESAATCVQCSQCNQYMHLVCSELQDGTSCPKCSYNIELSIANFKYQNGDYDPQHHSDSHDDSVEVQQTCLFCTQGIDFDTEETYSCPKCCVVFHQQCENNNEISGDGMCPNCEYCVLIPSSCEVSDIDIDMQQIDLDSDCSSIVSILGDSKLMPDQPFLQKERDLKRNEASSSSSGSDVELLETLPPSKPILINSNGESRKSDSLKSEKKKWSCHVCTRPIEEAASAGDNIRKCNQCLSYFHVLCFELSSSTSNKDNDDDNNSDDDICGFCAKSAPTTTTTIITKENTRKTDEEVVIRKRMTKLSITVHDDESSSSSSLSILQSERGRKGCWVKRRQIQYGGSKKKSPTGVEGIVCIDLDSDNDSNSTIGSGDTFRACYKSKTETLSRHNMFEEDDGILDLCSS